MILKKHGYLILSIIIILQLLYFKNTSLWDSSIWVYGWAFLIILIYIVDYYLTHKIEKLFVDGKTISYFSFQKRIGIKMSSILKFGFIAFLVGSLLFGGKHDKLFSCGFGSLYFFVVVNYLSEHRKLRSKK